MGRTRWREILAAWVMMTPGILLGGCVGGAPSVLVTDATVLETTEEAVAIGIGLDLVNGSSVPLDVRQIDYVVSVDGRTVYEGRRAAQTTLPSAGASRIDVPAVIRFDDAGWTDASAPPSATYRISGHVLYLSPGELAEILLDAGVRKPTVSFRGEGRVALRREPD